MQLGIHQEHPLTIIKNPLCNGPPRTLIIFDNKRWRAKHDEKIQVSVSNWWEIQAQGESLYDCEFRLRNWDVAERNIDEREDNKRDAETVEWWYGVE